MANPPKITQGPRRTGRRAGPNRTRAAILTAARSAFATHGYDAVSVRAVARDAGVDPALVHRFFGTKDELFSSAMQLPVAPNQLAAMLLAEGLDGIGERIVEAFLSVNDAPGAFTSLLALLRGAASNEQAATMLREFVTTEILGRIAVFASPDQPELRAALAGSQIVGLAMARYVVRIPQAADADISHLSACIGPTIERYLTGTLPTPTADREE